MVVGDTLYHVGRRPVVGAHAQRVVLPRLEEVERERVGVLRCQLWVAKRYHRGVARVAETVELPAPGSPEPSRVVELQLLCLVYLIRKEYAREELEVVFLERIVAFRRVVLLLIVVALGVYVPVFAAQTCHHSESAELHCGCGIERVQIHVVYKAVIVSLVFHLVYAFP